MALRQAASVGLADFDAGRYDSFADGEAVRSRLATRASNVLGRSPE